MVYCLLDIIKHFTVEFPFFLGDADKWMFYFQVNKHPVLSFTFFATIRPLPAFSDIQSNLLDYCFLKVKLEQTWITLNFAVSAQRFTTIWRIFKFTSSRILSRNRAMCRFVKRNFVIHDVLFGEKSLGVTCYAYHIYDKKT